VTYSALAILMTPRQGANGTMVFMINVVMIIAIFYFILIRPQRKEQERHRAMLAAIKKGDEVVTGGGIIGIVVHAEEDRLTIKSGENTRLVVERARVARVVVDDAAKEASKEAARTGKAAPGEGKAKGK